MTPLGYFVAHLTAADFFSLLIAVVLCVYLTYALIRGEKF
jgi:K+-transporting ATPase KdpF subunit